MDKNKVAVLYSKQYLSSQEYSCLAYLAASILWIISLFVDWNDLKRLELIQRADMRIGTIPKAFHFVQVNLLL